MTIKAHAKRHGELHEPRHFAWMVAICAAILFAGLVTALTSSTRSATPHTGPSDCATCHLNDVATALAEDDELLFTTDIDTLCSECHELEPGLSHPSGVQALDLSPEGFPLDWAGRITCATCHYTHQDSKPDATGYMIRGEKLGRAFCQSCHEDIAQTVGRKHDTSLTRSHLESPRVQARARSLLDSISLQCLGCHDGIIGSMRGVEIGESTGLWEHSDIGLSHPIGVSYPPAGNKSRGYRPTASLDPRIRIFDGKLGCASCHDAYSEAEHGLVMDNTGSALCLACHIK